MTTPLLSEFVTVNTAIEATNGTLPTTGWRTLQPNPDGIQDFYPQIKKLARSPLSHLLMDEKGDVIDLDAMPKIVQDLNKDLLDQYGQSMFRSVAKYPGGTGVGRWNATAGLLGAQVSAVTISQFTVSSGGALPTNVLVYARGFANAANNGLFVVQAASTGTAIKVTGTVAEASPPAAATVEVVGIQGASADITCTATQILSTALDFTTLGLTQYAWAWVGGGTAAAPGNFGFATAADRGLIRMTAIAAHAITFDRASTTWVTDAGTGKTIQIFFGPFLRNVAGDAGDYLRTSHSLELVLPSIGAAGATDYVYVPGAGLGAFEISSALTDRAIATLGFVGFDCQDPTTTRQTGASAALAPNITTMFNTVGDMKRLRVMDTTGASILSDIESWKLSISNNVKPYKKQGTFGAADLIFGKFQVDLTIDGVVAQDDLWKAVRDNRSLMFESLLRNNDCAVMFDIPGMTAEGAAPKFSANALATFSPTFKTFRDPTSGFVMGGTVFPYLPAS